MINNHGLCGQPTEDVVATAGMVLEATAAREDWRAPIVEKHSFQLIGQRGSRVYNTISKELEFASEKKTQGSASYRRRTRRSLRKRYFGCWRRRLDKNPLPDNSFQRCWS